MNRAEVAELFKKIKRAYSSFDVMDIEKVDEWQSYLKNVSLEVALENLRRHIATEKFPPTIAELSRPLDPEKTDNELYHERLREAAIQRLEEIEAWRKKAVPPPAHVKERMREIAAGNRTSVQS